MAKKKSIASKNGKTTGIPIGKRPEITSKIEPSQINASTVIRGGFGSYEREVIAQAAVQIFQEKGGWNWIISGNDIKAVLLKLGVPDMAKPKYDLEGTCPGDGALCPAVGDGRLLQKVGKNVYAATDLFITTCYKHNPRL